MKFYNKQHKYYCGIDLHAKKMYICVMNQMGKIIIHQNVDTDPDASIMEGFSILTGMSVRLLFIYSFPHSHLGYCMLKLSMGLTNYKFNITRLIEHSEMIAKNIL